MSLLSVGDARARILSGAYALEKQTVALDDAHGRTLSEPLVAQLTQPPFDASAMDGYAVQSGDLTGDGVTLRIIGESAAGHPFDGTVGTGQTVRIFTGAPVPAGSDAVVIQEHTTRNGDSVTIINTTINSSHIRVQGFDFAKGDELLPAGRILGARELSLAAAMGIGTAPVARRPRVAILSTGDELVPPGIVPANGQIISSNHLGIAALVRQAGGEPLQLGIAGDSEQSLNDHMDRARDADILVTIGGASVGDHDLVGPVLKSRGMNLDFWKIAMRPGKPLMFGTLARPGHNQSDRTGQSGTTDKSGTTDQRVIGLPGNPISSLICARVFLTPLIYALLGATEPASTTRSLPLTAPLGANGPRQHYMRACITIGDDGAPSVTPLPSQDSSLLSAFARAECLIVRPPNAATVPSGEQIQVLLLDF